MTTNNETTNVDITNIEIANIEFHQQSELETALLEDLQEEELLESARPYMEQGLIASIHTPRKCLTPQGMRKHTLRSVFFLQAAHMGLHNPAIISLNTRGIVTSEFREKVMARFQRRMRRMLDQLGLQIYAGTPGDRGKIFVARPSDLKFLPDITQSPQRADSGYVIDPEANLGKVMKREKHLTGAQAASSVPGASRWPKFRTPIGTLQLETRDTETAGDGGGYARESMLRKLLAASGLNTKRPIIGVQFWASGEDYAYKGFIQAIPDEKMADEKADIILDAESVNFQVRNRHFSNVKLNPMFRHNNLRYVYLEPLNLGENAARFFDYRELTSVARELGDTLDRESWASAIRGQEDLVTRILEECLQDEPQHQDESYRGMAFQKDDNTLLESVALAGANPFASPEICRISSGQTAQRFHSKHHNASRMERQYFWVDNSKVNGRTVITRRKTRSLIRDKRKTQLPGVIVSGERVYLVHHEYRKFNAPRTGYGRLLWDETQEDQLIGFSMCKKDMLRYRTALDGADTDGDEVILMFYHDERNIPHVRVYRLPSSIDGGISLRVNQKDAAKLKGLGYRFYQLKPQGGPAWPGLHEGEEQYPTVLKPEPLGASPALRCDEEGILENILELDRYRHIIGATCNLAANLDQAGIYDPAHHKFLQSDVIDSVMYVEQDPSGIPDALAETLYAHVRAGNPVDPCVFWRALNRMEQLLERERKENPKAPPIIPVLECREHHKPLKDTMASIIKELNERSTTRQLWANGPIDWLFQEFPDELQAIVQRAVETRNSIWSERNRKDREIPQDLSREEIQFQKAKHLEAAFQDERDATSAAYEEAAVLESYEHGGFTALWFRMALGEIRRFHRYKTLTDGAVRVEKRKLEPIRTRATLALPLDEREGFYQFRAIVPTAIVRTVKRMNLKEGTPCRIEKDGKHFLLKNEQGRKICTLPDDAPHYTDIDLRVMGYMPQVNTPDASEDAESYAGNLLVLTTESWESIGLPQD